LFLLILESIGTPELLMIAVVALIVFGPRKLPQMAKTLGKTMADFKNATNEFKSTWEREAAFGELDNNQSKTTSHLTDTVVNEKSTVIDPEPVSAAGALSTPQIKELSKEEIAKMFPDNKILPENPPVEAIKPEPPVATKRDWL
jgi:sec-independent protein translocase protein TatA